MDLYLKVSEKTQQCSQIAVGLLWVKPFLARPEGQSLPHSSSTFPLCTFIACLLCPVIPKVKMLVLAEVAVNRLYIVSPVAKLLSYFSVTCCHYFCMYSQSACGYCYASACHVDMLGFYVYDMCWYFLLNYYFSYVTGASLNLIMSKCVSPSDLCQSL